MPIKRLTSIVFIFIFSCINFTRTENSQINYVKHVHDFGNIKFKSKAEYDFYYVNNRNQPISIKYVSVNCSCLSSKWSQEEISPKEKSKLTVRKDTGIPGGFEDRILVYYNGLDIPDTLVIKGKVVYP
jgi:hypothetical protein